MDKGYVSFSKRCWKSQFLICKKEYKNREGKKKKNLSVLLTRDFTNDLFILSCFRIPKLIHSYINLKVHNFTNKNSKEYSDQMNFKGYLRGKCLIQSLTPIFMPQILSTAEVCLSYLLFPVCHIIEQSVVFRSRFFYIAVCTRSSE